MNLYRMRNPSSMRSLIIYVSIISIWLVQIGLVGSANSTSLSGSTNNKLAKLKSNKKALNKSLNKPFRNATLPASLSPAKLTKHLDEETPKTLYQISRDGRHQMLAFGSEITLAYQTQQLVFEEALLENAFNPNSSEANEIETSAQESIPFFFNQNAMCPKSRLQCFQSKFRTADGSCNNLRHPRWGKSFECYKRMMNPDFSDNFLMPRGSITGQELPNPRFISLRIHTGRMVRSKDVSNMFSQWGQFLDHDMTQTPLFRTPNGNLIDCCNGPDRFRQDRCAPIQVSRNDQFYTRFGISCLNFVRSSPCLTCSQSPRTQLNQLTSFIDASNIYGSLLNHTNALRMFDGTGRLRMSSNELLPQSLDMRTDQCSRPPQSVCFASGDSRANLTPGLVSMHTIWHRQHNSIALAMKRMNPHWDDERLFQETRRIVGAQMQHITYNEFVPLVIGPKRMNQFNLNVQSKGYTKYNPDMNPMIMTEFASAAFRFGHTLISPVYSRMLKNGVQTEYWLKDNYFNPHVLKDGELDNILRGMTASNAARTDPFIADDVRNHLYRRRQDGFGSDLIAFNIARAREHGIPGYVHLMRQCFNEKINNFEQLDGYMPRQQRMKLQSMYSHVNDIDLFTGGISEFPMPGGHVGPTFACVISKQFADLKFGDRYFYEHGDQSGSFSPPQLDSIRQTTLAKIICDNGDDFGQVSARAMELISDKNPVVPCNSMPRLDLNLWKEN